MLKKINNNNYKYKNIDVRFRNNVYYTVIALERHNNTPKIYEIEGNTQLEFIEAVNNCISQHMYLQAKKLI